jgi:hypothetical protein
MKHNVVYGMYSGLALLMDVYEPEEPNGYGVIFISGSGWSAPLGRDATPLKLSGQQQVYAVPLMEAGYTRASRPGARPTSPPLPRSGPPGSHIRPRDVGQTEPPAAHPRSDPDKKTWARRDD